MFSIHFVICHEKDTIGSAPQAVILTAMCNSRQDASDAVIYDLDM